MGSQLKIEVNEQELEFRAKNHCEINATSQRQLNCCSCGNVLSLKSGRIFSHKIFGIFQCEYCRNHLKNVTFNSEKDDSVKLCRICGRECKETITCKKENCPYEFCKNCIKRSVPNSLLAAKTQEWECFACNTKPLWNLRGACEIVMSTLSKRTKEKRDDSRNVSSDSEEITSNLKNVSFVRRSRLEETKRLGKRLKAVCDEESPVQQDDNPQSAINRQKKREKSDDSNIATKRGVKQVCVDKSSRTHKQLQSSSEDSDLEEIKISKPKSFVKSQSEREKRNSVNDRIRSHRKSRNSESHVRKKVIILDSSSDEDNELENTRSFRKSKHKDDSLHEKRKEQRATRESSVNRSKSSNKTHNKRDRNEKMSSTRKSKSDKKNYRSESSDDSSSDDSETKAIKGLTPSLFVEEKSSTGNKLAKLKKRKESSEDEQKISRNKSRGILKSSTSRSSNISSMSNKTNSKSHKAIEEEEEEEKDERKNAKKSSVKSPGPKSFKEGKIPRREKNSDDDSDRSVTKSSKNKEKRKSTATRRDSEAGGFVKSIGRRLDKNDKQKSDSSSGKEFKKTKVVRSSFVALRRIQDIEEDHTTSANEDPQIDETSDILTKDQTFPLKNVVNDIYAEMKVATTKLLNDIEAARKSYSMKDSMRVDEANRMVLQTKKIAKKFRDIVEKGDTKVTEYYDKWCTKTRIRNVLKPSTPKPKTTAKLAEESPEESSKNALPVDEKKAKSPKSKILNEQNNVVVSECDSSEIFSGDESRTSIDKTGLSLQSENANQDNIDLPTEENEREDNLKKSDNTAPSSDKEISDNVAPSSDKEISDNEAKIQSPTMSQFSGLSDVEENPPPKSAEKLQRKLRASEEQLDIPCESPKDEETLQSAEKLKAKSIIDTPDESTKDEEIPSGVVEEQQLEKSNDESEKSGVASSKPPRKPRKIQAAVLSSPDSDIKDSAVTEEISPSLQSEQQSNLEVSALDISLDMFSDTEKNEEKSNSARKKPMEIKTKVADLVVKKPEKSHKIFDKNALNNESENNPHDSIGVEKEQSEVESNESCDIASASTELMSYSPTRLSDEKEDDIQTSLTEAENNSSTDDINNENEEKTVVAKSSKDEGEEEEETSAPKKPKKVKSNFDRRSSAETVFADEVTNDDKNHTGNESSSSTEIPESQNAKAKEALLMSSNSEDSSYDERESTLQSTPKDGNDAPPTPPESDSKSDKNSVNHSPQIESTEKSKKKRGKFRLHENRHYIADEKVKLKCVVEVERLSKATLSRYSRALRKSRDYVESKNLKRLVALDKLGKDHKKSSIDCSDNEDGSSSKDLRNKRRARAAKEKEETLLDHLNKVKNGEATELSDESNSESSTRGSEDKDKHKNEDRLLSEANRMAKKRLLDSSDSGADEQPVSDAKEDETSKKTKKVVKKEKLEKPSDEDEEKKEKESEKNRWRKSKILTLKISDSDSEEEEKKFNASQEKIKEKKKEGSQSESDEEASLKKKKKKTQRVRRRVLHSDSDVVISSEKSSDSDSSVQSVKKKKKKKEESSEDEKDKKKTRKRTRRGRGSSDSSSSLDERPKPTRRKRIKKTGSDSDSDDQDSSQGSPGKSGRKNIRKVIRDKQVAEDTKQAAKEEEERLKRIADRQKLYNEMYEVRLAGEEKVDKLVLDFDEETKEPLVSVEEGLVKRLKPHQARGIKFMWDACFESLERIKSTKGSGCILAHCMGLGKSFQVVTLAYTLLTHQETGVKTVLVVCPLSTVLNWANEFKIWLADIDKDDEVEVYEMTKMKKNFERKFQLTRWHETGGVMIIGYEMFRNLTQQTGKKVRKNIQESFLKCLVDPGPDLIVCDEGHLLKNEDTALSKAMRRVKTLRRVVLTGTPLQNNLIEYHCMVQFVKPNLLGTKKEFMNRFENPITNGQFDDSTEYDVKLMKKRAHILHKLLEGSVQRFDYSVLTPFLPPKQEYVIFVKLTKIQLDMYQHYLDNYARRHRGVGGSLFADFQALQRIWTHPMVMQMNAEKVERANEKKRQDATDSEGSLRDFIDDGSDTPCTTNSSASDASDDEKKPTSKRSTRANPVAEEPEEEVAAATEEATTTDEAQWWAQYVKEDDYEDIRCSSKLLILFRIIKESEQIGDKILVFSQSLYSLTLIERFLELIDEETQKGNEPEKLDGLSGSWALGLDYFRLDGQTSADNRRRWCDIFNRPSNTRARLFLISTRAGGLGINLTAANRVVIFDASWNPSHDVQSIFRIYRFGQKKPCYVYRLLAAGTMEEKIYNRQVTKLSLSCRVVDEQQIERHYSNNALAELYKLELPSETETTLALPKDRLLAEIFLKYKSSVENYHEHDSLLENQAGEELDEEERQQAWLEYEEEKKGKRMVAPQPFINYQDAYLMQQINAMNMGPQGTLNNPAMFNDYQNLQRLMEKDYPHFPEAQQKIMASQAVFEMYNYVEKQAMANRGGGLQLPNLGALQGSYNNQIAQSMNPGQTYMDVLRMQQQQQQLLAQQQQNGQIKFANSQQQLRADILRQQQKHQMQYAQQAQRMGQSSTAAPITIDDDDIMEVPSAPEKNPVPPAQATEANPKNKEE